MKGILLYDEMGRRRNEWFIARLIEAARERGCELQLVITDEDFGSALTPLPDFAIVRTIKPELNARLESLGIPTYNNSATSRICNDKWQTYLLARELGIEAMETHLVNDDSTADTLTYPAVLKSVDGHGGSEVFLVKNACECKQKLSILRGKRIITQELCDEPGVDMRVYALGERTLAAVKRTSSSDFRSNFSLGGNAELDTPAQYMQDIIKKLRAKLRFDFVGIDFIRHGGSWVLNEIEDVVGTRMLYSLTDIDAADEYIEYIISKVK